MTEDPYTQLPYGPYKWAALGIAGVGTLISLVFSDNGWLGPALGYAIIIGMVCSVPIGRIFGGHARVVQLIGGLLIIALAVVKIRREPPAGNIAGWLIAALGAIILAQSIFPRLRTWRVTKNPEGTRPPFTLDDKGRRRPI